MSVLYIGLDGRSHSQCLIRLKHEVPNPHQLRPHLERLYALIAEVGQSHEPVQINGKRGNAVLLSEGDWRAIQETLHLGTIPGMRESILEDMATALRSPCW
jgi:antitoxin YefM